MATRKSILIVSVAPSNAIANIAKELASRGHFTIFASANPLKHMKVSSGSMGLHSIAVDTHSPTALSRASNTVASALGNNGFSGLDVLINDVGAGSSLALLDIMMEGSREQYDTKVADAMSLLGSFANLLARNGGKVVNMSSSGAMVSAPCMNKTSHFSAERAITGISEQMRLEVFTGEIEIETAMLESVPSATESSPRILLPERSSYSSAKSAISRWTWGGRRPPPSLEPLFDLVLEDSTQRASTYLWDDWSNLDREDDVSRLEKGFAAPAVC